MIRYKVSFPIHYLETISVRIQGGLYGYLRLGLLGKVPGADSWDPPREKSAEIITQDSVSHLWSKVKGKSLSIELSMRNGISISFYPQESKRISTIDSYQCLQSLRLQCGSASLRGNILSNASGFQFQTHRNDFLHSTNGNQVTANGRGGRAKIERRYDSKFSATMALESEIKGIFTEEYEERESLA